ncbi:MAG: hypothetical protein ABJD13_12985 [Paracoccaceae bacterium]
MSDSITVTVQLDGQSTGMASFDMVSDDAAPPPVVETRSGDAETAPAPPSINAGSEASAEAQEDSATAPPPLEGSDSDSADAPMMDAGDDVDLPPPPDV